MLNICYKLDKIKQWIRYPQPSSLQAHLLGLHTDVIDYSFTAKRLASESSARYMIDNMLMAKNFDDDYSLREALPELVSKHFFGNIMEFGVASGRSINQLAKLFPHHIIHGFDSFEGLPEDWSANFPKGHFAQDVPKVAKNVKIHCGLFQDTLPDFIDKNHCTSTRNIKLLHIDCDLYSSTNYVLEQVKDQLIIGSVILFDEYLNYPGYENHEFKAWHEFAEKYNMRYEYIAICSKHQQVALKITGIN